MFNINCQTVILMLVYIFSLLCFEFLCAANFSFVCGGLAKLGTLVGIKLTLVKCP